jgi:hypothetical protein
MQQSSFPDLFEFRCSCGRRLKAPAWPVYCACGAVHREALEPVTRMGPGSVLARMLADLGVPHTRACGCADMAAQMDRWGWAGCLARREQIVAHLTERFRALPWRTKLAVVRAAACKARPFWACAVWCWAPRRLMTCVASRLLVHAIDESRPTASH